MEEEASPPWRHHQHLFLPSILSSRIDFSFCLLCKIKPRSFSSTLDLSDPVLPFYHLCSWSSLSPSRCLFRAKDDAHWSYLFMATIAGQPSCRRLWQQGFSSSSQTVVLPATFSDCSFDMAFLGTDCWWKNSSSDYDIGSSQWLVMGMLVWWTCVCFCSHLFWIWSLESWIVSFNSFLWFARDDLLESNVALFSPVTLSLLRPSLWQLVCCSITFSSEVAPAPFFVKSSPCCSSSSLIVLVIVDVRMAFGVLPFGRVRLSRGVGVLVVRLVVLCWLLFLLRVGVAVEVIWWGKFFGLDCSLLCLSRLLALASFTIMIVFVLGLWTVVVTSIRVDSSTRYYCNSVL